MISHGRHIQTEEEAVTEVRLHHHSLQEQLNAFEERLAQQEHDLKHAAETIHKGLEYLEA